MTERTGTSGRAFDSGVAVACAAVACYVLVGENGAHCVRIAVGCAILLALCVASLWVRRWPVGLLSGATVAVVVFWISERERNASSRDGIVTVRATLTVRGAALAQGAPLSVSWVSGGGSDWRERPWASGRPDGAEREFATEIDIMVYNRPGCFCPAASWSYHGQPPIILRVGGDTVFGFLPDDLFAAPHRGPPPGSVAGVVDIDDLLSGARRSRPLGELDLR